MRERKLVLCLVSFTLVVLLVACAQSSPSQPVSPVIETVLVTVEVTRIVEVEEVVEVPVTVEVTRVVVQTPTPIPTAASPALSALTPDRVGEFTGTYAWSKGDGSGAGCMLQVLHKTTLEPYDQLEFMLGCNRGAPSYNLGEASGEMIVASSVPPYSSLAVYTPILEGWRNDWCHLVFEFNTDVVTVTQVGMDFDCGFGASVRADGTYDRIDNRIPEFGCMDDGSCERYAVP